MTERGAWIVVAMGVLAVGFLLNDLRPVRSAQKSKSATTEHRTTVTVKEPTEKRASKYHWYALDASQATKLKNELSAIPARQRRPVWILCDPATDCLDIAQDFDTAFEEAGWKSEIERPGALVNGLHVTSVVLADIIHASTRIPVVVDPDEQERLVVNFGRKNR